MDLVGFEIVVELFLFTDDIGGGEMGVVGKVGVVGVIGVIGVGGMLELLRFIWFCLEGSLLRIFSEFFLLLDFYEKREGNLGVDFI